MVAEHASQTVHMPGPELAQPMLSLLPIKNRMQVLSENGTAAKQRLGKVKKICIYQAVFFGGR